MGEGILPPEPPEEAWLLPSPKHPSSRPSRKPTAFLSSLPDFLLAQPNHSPRCKDQGGVPLRPYLAGATSKMLFALVTLLTLEVSLLTVPSPAAASSHRLNPCQLAQPPPPPLPPASWPTAPPAPPAPTRTPGSQSSAPRSQQPESRLLSKTTHKMKCKEKSGRFSYFPIYHLT